MTDALEIRLPLPPSVNKIWVPVPVRGGAVMVKRKAYKDWAAMAAREVAAQRAGLSINGAFRVSLLLPTGRHDGDNLIKPILDACQHGGAIANDRDCIGGTWDMDDTREGLALIVLTPIPPARCQPARTKGHAGKDQNP